MSRLSILCASYGNTEHQIRVLVHSILNQSFKDFTLYFLVDGTDEMAREVCRSIKDERLKFQESLSRTGKYGFPLRNKKLFEISSKYVCFQSADNYVVPTAYETLVNAAETNNLDIVYCDILHNYPNINSYCLDGTIDKTKFSPPYTVLDSSLALNKIDLTNFVMKTKIAQELGGFRTNLPDKLQPGADGILIEDLKARYRDKLRAAKITKQVLLIHN